MRLTAKQYIDYINSKGFDKEIKGKLINAINHNDNATRFMLFAMMRRDGYKA